MNVGIKLIFCFFLFIGLQTSVAATENSFAEMDVITEGGIKTISVWGDWKSKLADAERDAENKWDNRANSLKKKLEKKGYKVTLSYGGNACEENKEKKTFRCKATGDISYNKLSDSRAEGEECTTCMYAGGEFSVGATRCMQVGINKRELHRCAKSASSGAVWLHLFPRERCR